MKISVILPTYNEYGNIGNLVEAIETSLSNTNHEIIIIDDMSPDKTWEKAQELEKTHKNVRAIIRKDEKGLATALMRGIKESTGTHIALMDTDFNHPPELLRQMSQKLDEYDLITASRYIPGGRGGEMSNTQYKLSKLLNLYVEKILSLNVKDSTAGYFIIKKLIIEQLPQEKIFTGYGDYFFRLLYLTKKMNVKTLEVPVVYGKRIYGESKTKRLKMGIDYGWGALKLRLFGIK
ncbi:MAG: glycosyltransferase [Candidatus Nanoarchaeia archaeon]|nr:glycosyltransferase [Candidatus Nanoarchaeia archaeon]